MKRPSPSKLNAICPKDESFMDLIKYFRKLYDPMVGLYVATQFVVNRKFFKQEMITWLVEKIS